MKEQEIIEMLFRDAKKTDCEDCQFEEDCKLNNPDFDANGCRC